MCHYVRSTGPVRPPDPGLLHPALGAPAPQRRSPLVRPAADRPAGSPRCRLAERLAAGHRLRPGRPLLTSPGASCSASSPACPPEATAPSTCVVTTSSSVATGGFRAATVDVVPRDPAARSGRPSAEARWVSARWVRTGRGRSAAAGRVLCFDQHDGTIGRLWSVTSKHRRSAVPSGTSELVDVSFDRYARLVRRAVGAPVGLVTMVESDRQVFVGALGTPRALPVHAADAVVALVLPVRRAGPCSAGHLRCPLRSTGR